MIVGRTEEKLEDAAKKIKTDTGVEIKTLSADVSCMEDCEAMVQEVVSTFGKIDCAFLNAGVHLLACSSSQLQSLVLQTKSGLVTALL